MPSNGADKYLRSESKLVCCATKQEEHKSTFLHEWSVDRFSESVCCQYFVVSATVPQQSQQLTTELPTWVSRFKGWGQGSPCFSLEGNVVGVCKLVYFFLHPLPIHWLPPFWGSGYLSLRFGLCGPIFRRWLCSPVFRVLVIWAILAHHFGHG